MPRDVAGSSLRENTGEHILPVPPASQRPANSRSWERDPPSSSEFCCSSLRLGRCAGCTDNGAFSLPPEPPDGSAEATLEVHLGFRYARGTLSCSAADTCCPPLHPATQRAFPWASRDERGPRGHQLMVRPETELRFCSG